MIYLIIESDVDQRDNLVNPRLLCYAEQPEKAQQFIDAKVAKQYRKLNAHFEYNRALLKWKAENPCPIIPDIKDYERPKYERDIPDATERARVNAEINARNDIRVDKAEGPYRDWCARLSAAFPDPELSVYPQVPYEDITWTIKEISRLNFSDIAAVVNS